MPLGGPPRSLSVRGLPSTLLGHGAAFLIDRPAGVLYGGLARSEGQPAVPRPTAMWRRGRRAASLAPSASVGTWRTPPRRRTLMGEEWRWIDR